ncbi:MAG: hypothetical protein MI923_00650 [Phycisphaerales bacterium]|nr:hypothetical protein [Phycisphaerales bacterium]
MGTFEGGTRVIEVYPVWFVAYGILIASMLFLRIRRPKAIFCLVILFLIKDIIIDYALADVSRPRVYWAEHAPLAFWLVAIGILGWAGLTFFKGYVGRYTVFLAAATFILDFYKDLIESPSVYGR